MATVDVSIIMPAYNAEKYIEESIDSILKQTFTSWELIVVNDGSKDNTEAIVAEIAKRDNRVILVNQVNKKLPAARNTGIKVAKGNWIAFLDADDTWPPQKLENQILEANKTNTDLVYTGGYIADENLNIISEYPTIYGLQNAEDMYKGFFKGNIVPVLSVIVKAKWVNQIGYFDEGLVYGCEDWDYWLRLSNVGCDFYGLDEKLFYYRRHGNNMSSNLINMRLAQTGVFLKNFDIDRFDKQQAEKLFKPMVWPLVIELIIAGRKSDCYYLIDSMQRVLPSLSNKLSKLAIKYLEKKAARVVSILN